MTVGVAELSIRGRRNSKLHGEHIATHPGRRNDFVTHGFNLLDLLIAHQMRCTLHLDDHFVFTDIVVAVLEVEGEGSLRTALDEYLAEWAIDKIINMLSL
jgi:hypothetical protein